MPSKEPDSLPTPEALCTATLPELRNQYTKLEGNAPPKSIKSDFLRVHIAWFLQALQQKQDPVALRQKLLNQANITPTSAPPACTPGTRLIREWQGVTHEVTVLDQGFSYQGELFRSLSQIAEIITGTHWSGPRFFGLKKPLKAA